MKNQKGITLIALVVTIIVLLILAGISIAMLTGDNGILINAQKTSTYNAYYSAEEQVKLAYMSVRTEIMAETVTDGTYDARVTAATKKLAKLVKNDLVGNLSVNDARASKGTWEVTYTPIADEKTSANATQFADDKYAVIYIKYTDTSIDATKIDGTHPKEEGVVHYTITLSDQGASLQTDIGNTSAGTKADI